MLNTVSPSKGSRKKAKRVGRGNSGNGGTTAGRGNKGQHSRTGSTRRAGFEGGQTPLLRRQPKLGGFKNPNRIEFEVLNVGTLEQELDAGTYDVPTLIDKKIIRTKKPVKLLGQGELKKKFTLTVNAASKTAVEAVEKAGGKVTIE
ncbi:MAG: 50S ribosomal protein L15 [Candidatus Peribacteraceae bacterium]|nr:50S ribosomal protein L15 [Candidatus Peribacteraceae bacterium]